MTLKTQMAADLESVFFNTDDFAEDIIYTPSGGEDGDITVRMVPGEEDPGSQTPYPPGDSMIIGVLSSEVTVPGRGDTYIIDGTTWYHEQVVRGGPEEGVYHIRLTRSERRKISDRTY